MIISYIGSLNQLINSIVNPAKPIWIIAVPFSNDLNYFSPMILYRYIIKEHIFPFLAALSIIVFFFIMQQMVLLLDRIVSKGLDPSIVLEVFVIQLGWIIALAIPM